MDAPLLLPVGHWMGPFHPAPGEPARHVVVRVGWDTPKLTGDDEVDVWQAAHRPGAELDPTVVDRLVERGLLVRVGTDPEDLSAFARGHRLQTLLVGAADVDGRHPVGTAGGPPVALLDDPDFEVWAWVHLFPDLLGAAAGLATADSERRGQHVTPEAVLERLVAAVPRLLADDLVYLDAVRDPS